MTEYIKKCAICGREFTASAANSKYCSDPCRAKGKAQQRQKWEQNSGYLDRQRETMRQRRAEIAAIQKNEAEKEQKEKAEIQEKKNKARAAAARRALKRAAANGDSLARMELALENGGNCNPDYWNAFKNYEIEFARSINEISTTTVNDISVNNPEFEFLVILSLNEWGGFFTHSGTRKED